MYQID